MSSEYVSETLNELGEYFTAIARYCDLLLDNVFEPLTEEQRVLIAIVRRTAIDRGEILKLYLADMDKYSDRMLFLGHLRFDFISPIRTICNGVSLLLGTDDEVGIASLHGAQLVQVKHIQEVCERLTDWIEAIIAELEKLTGRKFT